MAQASDNLLTLTKRLGKLRTSILEDVAADVGGPTVAGSAALADPGLGFMAAILCAGMIFLRGRAGKQRMLAALDSVADILHEQEDRVAELESLRAAERLDKIETQIAKFLELAARDENQDKLDAARHYLTRHVLSGRTAQEHLIDEEFERWLQEATTLELRCVLVLRRAEALDGPPFKYPKGTYPTMNTLPRMLTVDFSTTKRILDRLDGSHLISQVRQEPDRPHPELARFGGGTSDAYGLTALGEEFRTRMSKPE